MRFDLTPACKEDINKIFKLLNASKATGTDGIPLKFIIKLSTSVVDKYLTSIINYDISRPYFSDGAKYALVRHVLLFYFIKDAQLLSFMDGTTSATFSNNIDDLIADLQKEFENVIDWFRSNEMVVNLDKFQSIIINRLGKFKNSYKLLIENHKVYSKNFVTLLGIEIDNKLNFGKHLTTVYQKAGRHLNTLSGKHKYNEFQE